ncbi:MAG: PAS domain S-box protein [Phycisphaeraceae bacterium]
MGVRETTRDITDPRQADEKLRHENDLQFRAIFQAATIGVAQVDPTTRRFLRVNPTFSAITGYDEAELLNMTVDQLNHPDDRASDQQRYQQLLQANGDYRLEKRYVRKDGSVVWVRVNGTVVHDADGRPLMATAIVEDISQHKQAEAALAQATAAAKQQKRLYETILSNTPDLVYVFDLNYRFTYANPALLNMWGRSWEDAVGKRLLEIGYEPWHARMHEREIDQVVATGKPVRGEVPFPHHSLGRRIYDYIFVPILGPDGKVVAVAGTTRDVTEARRAAQALRRSEQQREVAMDAARMGLWTYDLATEVLQHDHRAGELLGLTGRPQITRQDVLDRIHEDDRARVSREIEAALAPGSNGRFDSEYRVRREAGGYRWVHSVGRAQLQSDKTQPHTRFVGVLLDTTERKLAEQRLQQLNDTLEQRVTERTAEARQRADQLQRLAAELTDTEQRERRRLAQWLHDDLQQILVAAKMRLTPLRETGEARAVDEAEQLLAQAIETSRSLTIELAPPVLYDLDLNTAMAWLARSVREKYGLNVDVVADDTVPVEREQLRVLLFTAVRELLLNVVKHASVDHARIILQRGDGQLRVAVDDRGAGFDIQTHYARAERSGYGLFSLQERLELLGGQVRIDSEPGKGTHVEILVPQLASPQADSEAPAVERECEPDPPAEPLPADPAATACTRVLLADDHEVVRRGVAQLIEQQKDMQVIAEAASGEEAVALARQHRPAVVVMDISLPGISGVDATRQIMAELPEACVIGLSIHEEQDVAAAMQAAGARAYLNKSEAAAELVQAIRQFAPRTRDRNKQPSA